MADNITSSDDPSFESTLASSSGAGLVGYGISNDYPANTVGSKLNGILTPYDFGAVADNTLHPLSEYYSTLAAAQEVYSFVTSLDQSIDYAALQAWLNEIEARGGCYGSAGGVGQFRINKLPELNKTYSDNTLNKVLDFSGTTIYVDYGDVIITENNASGFANWTYSGSAAVNGDTISFTGNTSTQSKAVRVLTGLTVGELYCVSVKIEDYTEAAGAYIGFFYGTSAGISTARMALSGGAGPTVYHCEFVATAESHSIIILDDTYSSSSIVCSISEVDVRLAAYGLRVYQQGTAITHGLTIIRNPRFISGNDAAFGALRLDSLNHSVIENLSATDFVYGPAIHLCNLYTWSENNSIIKPNGANCREVLRFTRPARGTGTTSFSRTRVKDPIFSGCRYFAVIERSCSVYDSEFDAISGNMTSNARAIFSIHGDQNDTKFHGTRVEEYGVLDEVGIFEFGRNDLRRPWFGNGGTNSPKLITDGSFAAGTTTQENVQSVIDFRPAAPIFKSRRMQEISGALNTGASYPVGVLEWHEILLNCVSGSAYTVNCGGLYPAHHGIFEIDAHLRNADGTALQGSCYSVRLHKTTVSATNANKVIIFEKSSAVNNETISLVWIANSPPQISFTYSGTGAATNRSIALYVRYLQ